MRTARSDGDLRRFPVSVTPRRRVRVRARNQFGGDADDDETSFDDPAATGTGAYPSRL
jgi:hypothetical protein